MVPVWGSFQNFRRAAPVIVIWEYPHPSPRPVFLPGAKITWIWTQNNCLCFLSYKLPHCLLWPELKSLRSITGCCKSSVGWTACRMQILFSHARGTAYYCLEFTPDIPVNWQIETAPKSHKALKYFPLFENLMQFCNDGLAGSNIPSRSKLTRNTEFPAILKSSSGKLGLREREVDYSNNMIGYPSGQDGAILPARDTGFVPQGKFIMF